MVDLESVRFIMGAQRKLQLHQMDLFITFPRGEEVHDMRQHEGFTDKCEKKLCCLKCYTYTWGKTITMLLELLSGQNIEGNGIQTDIY